MPEPGQLLDRVVLATNPIAGRATTGEDAHRLARLLTDSGLAVEIIAGAENAAAAAKEWLAQGRLRALVGVGGDGTMNRLLALTPPETPLCVLPRGTENLLARHFSLGPAVEQVAETIVAGRWISLDAGEAGGQPFLLMASCGFDAQVVARLTARRKGHITPWSYAEPIWHSVRTYRYPELRVRWESADDTGRPASGGPVSGEGRLTARWLFLFNLPCYGGGLRFAPQADGTDGRLDLCAFHRGGCWNGLRYLCAVRRGRHERLADCTSFRLTRVCVEADAPVPYQIDGDLGGWLPLEIRVLPGRVRLLAPR